MAQDISYSHGHAAQAKGDPVTGIAVLVAISVAFILLFVVSIVVSDSYWSRQFLWDDQSSYSHFFEPIMNTTSLLYGLVALAGIALTFIYRRHITRIDLGISALFAAVVAVSISKHFLFAGLSDPSLYLNLAYHCAAVIFTVLGSLGLLRAGKVMCSRLAGLDLPKAAVSVAIGVAAGLIGGLICVVVLRPLLSGESLFAPFDVSTNTMVSAIFFAGEMGVMGAACFCLLILGVTLTALARFLPDKYAKACGVVATGVFFGMAISVFIGLYQLPLLMIPAIVLLGIPAASLAVLRDIETAVGFAWAFYFIYLSLLIL